jgi:biotin-[acetyl-CoA-carboxylase] ligase BirA-like protein
MDVEYHHLARTGSTMDEAAALWANPLREPGPLVVRADTQTAGRGRTGRMWESPRGALLLTAVIASEPWGDYIHLVPLVTGWVLSETLREEVGVQCQIKWPNDLLVGGKKIAGILCNSVEGGSAKGLAIGVGVNVNNRSGNLLGELRQPATSVVDETGREAKLDQLTEKFCARLFAECQQRQGRPLGDLKAKIEEQLAWSGEKVSCDYTDDRPGPTGIIRGLDDLGRLILKTELGGFVSLASGEIRHLKQQ